MEEKIYNTPRDIGIVKGFLKRTLNCTMNQNMELRQIRKASVPKVQTNRVNKQFIKWGKYLSATPWTDN